MADLVTYALDGGITTITMDDGKANALSIPMLAELHAAFEQAEADRATVVLGGRDERFSGGFHLPTLRARGQDGRTMVRSGADLAIRMLTFPAPLVIACPGHAVAMASLLLLCGDYRVGASGPYRICANEVAIGLTMPRSMIEIARCRLNPSQLHRSLALAEAFSPQLAVGAGFLDRVVQPGEVLAEAHDAARGYTALDMEAYRATKARLHKKMLPRLRDLIDKEFPL